MQPQGAHNSGGGVQIVRNLGESQFHILAVTMVLLSKYTNESQS
jgi:hypothetical protein